MSELVAQKSFFKLRGKICGTESDRYFSEGVSKKNNKAWKRINLGVDTTPDSKIFIEMMANEMDNAYAYSRSEKKSMAINWDKRNSVSLPKGFVIIKPDWDRLDEIREQFDEGDDVLVTGYIQYSEYNDKPQQRFIIKNMRSTSKEIDFDAEDFEEVNEFTQELTVTDVTFDKSEGKIFLTAYIIQDRGKNNLPDIQTAVFVIYPEKDKAFAKLVSGFKFGDTLKVQGIINSKIIKEEIEQKDGWGKVNTVITKTIKELELTGGFSETYEKKKYKESDFDEVFTKKSEEKEINTFAQDEEEDIDDKPPWED